MYYGSQLYQAKDLILAKEKLDSCILLNLRNDECKYYRAKIEYDMKSYQKASIMFKNVLALQENDASSWHMLGLCFTSLKHYDSAEFCFKNAVRLNSRRSEFYANWGNSQFLRGNFEHADQLYGTAILLDEKQAQYYVNRAEIRAKLGNNEDAQVDLKQALSIDPSNAMAQKNLAERTGFDKKWLFFLALGFVLFFSLFLFLRSKKH
jgi:tetratricopeptide (TPR) repeat protein